MELFPEYQGNVQLRFHGHGGAIQCDVQVPYHLFAGMLINLSVLFALTEGAKIHYLAAESLAILIVFIFNYLSSTNYVWHNAG